MKEHTERIPSLDGLRAISIGMVIVSHMVVTQNLINRHGPLGIWLDSLGLLGVRVFFVISGFLITSLLLRELDTEQHIRLTRFYFRRTLRIFPPYYFLLLMVVVFQAAGWLRLAPYDMLHAVTYTVNYYPDRSWYVGHGWSLSVEEQFYLLWPATLLLAGKRRGLWIAALLLVVCPLIRLVYFYFIPSLAKYEIDYRFETVADAIAAGCLLAGTFSWLNRQRIYQNILGSKLFVLAPIAVLAVGSSISLHKYHPQLYLLLGITVQDIGIAACIAWCVTHRTSVIGRLLNSTPFVVTGVMSYSIYLWQQLFLRADSSPTLIYLCLNLVLVAMASLVSYRLIERPALHIRHRLENRVFSYPKQRVAQHGTSLQDEEPSSVEALPIIAGVEADSN